MKSNMTMSNMTMSNMTMSNMTTSNITSKPTVSSLLHQYQDLLTHGWITETIDIQQNQLPITCFRTPHSGPSVWILTGIHGEEIAGPIALSHSVDTLLKLSQHISVVILPMCNPVGYMHGHRYPMNDSNSVGDCEWLLKKYTQPAVLHEARALAKFVLTLQKDYHPILTLDLHEDCMSQVTDKHSYIYSHGIYGRRDPIALYMVHVLEQAGVPPLHSGLTRFQETINNGIVDVKEDGSIDELFASHYVLSPTVIVIETPCNLPLSGRVNAQRKVIDSLLDIYKI